MMCDFLLQDADDREPDLSEEPKKKERAESEVDLETDRSLVVDISDALSEQDKVKYTVHTKVSFVEKCRTCQQFYHTHVDNTANFQEVRFFGDKGT